MITDDGEKKGVIPIEEALAAATAAGLDLVEVSPNAEPPVCRLMDYGRFAFEKSKSQNQARKKTKRTQIKEIKFRPGTDIGDYNVKLKKLKEFLENGDKTKVTIRFRGREMAHQELGKELLDRVEEDLADYGVVEQYPKLEGRQMLMVLAPGKRKAPKT